MSVPVLPSGSGAFSSGSAGRRWGALAAAGVLGGAAVVGLFAAGGGAAGGGASGGGAAGARPPADAAVRSAAALSFAAPAAATTTPGGATVIGTQAPDLGSPAGGAPVVTGIAAVTSGAGYYVLRADGTVDAYGVPALGSVAGLPTGVYASAIAVDPKTGGYWVVASDGQVFAFDAPWYGEPQLPPGGWGQYPAAVGLAAAPSGAGYYVLRANGAIDNFGAPAHGSLAGKLLYGATAPVTATALAVDPVTGGYWETTSVGGVYAFDAPWRGSPASTDQGYQGDPVTAIAALAGQGYAVLHASGAIDTFGAPNAGSAAGQLPLGATAAAIAPDGATGGYWTAVNAATVGGYLNPFRALTSLVPQEIDQGVDYCASGPIYALGAGVVLNTVSSGWPGGGFISYRLSGGPAAGEVVYAAENVTPSVTVGERVTPTTVIGILHDSATCLETGWASATSQDEAAGFGEFNGANSTAFGLNFSALLQAVGAPPGLVQNAGPPGPLPSNWPRIGSAEDGSAGVAVPEVPVEPPTAAEANWVAAAARGVLGAPWSTSGIAAQAAALHAGSTTPAAVVGWLQRSTQARSYQVQLAYRVVFGAAPTASQTAAGLTALDQGVGLRRFRADLAGSSEFAAQAGSGVNALIAADYRVFLGRAVDPAGLSSWRAAVAGGLSATGLGWDIETSAEGTGVVIDAAYLQLLHRAVDPGALVSWGGALQRGLSLAQLDGDLIDSSEFFDTVQG